MANDNHPAARSEPRAVYAITERGEKSYWTKVGVAFENRDRSITIQLEAFPVSGRLQIRTDDPRGTRPEEGR